MAKLRIPRPRNVHKRVREREEAERKENVTFRLNVRLMRDFRKACKGRASMVGVLEELLRQFLEAN